MPEELPSIDDLFASATDAVVADTPAPDDGDTPTPEDEGNPEPVAEDVDDDTEDGEDTKSDDVDDDDVVAEDTDDDDDSDDVDDVDESSDPPPLIDELKELLGYETEAEYDDSPEGLVEFFRESADQHAEQQMDRVFEEFPLVKALLEYQLNGGDEESFVETFFGQTDYGSLEIGEKDYALQERVFRDELKSRGYSDEEIEDEIEHAKSGDRLYKNATRALDILQKNQESSKAELLQQQQEAAQAQREQQLELQNQAKELIKSKTNIRGIPLPEKDKLEFTDYLFKPDAEGVTPYQKDLAGADMEIELATALLLYRGFDLSGLIGGRAKSQQARSLRDRLKNGKQPNSSGERPERDVKNRSPQEVADRLDYDALMNG